MVSHSLLDLELLDDYDPCEIDKQAAHLFKHPHLGIGDVLDMWMSDPGLLSRQAARALADVRRGRWNRARCANSALAVWPPR